MVSKMVRIEVQNQQGQWTRYTGVANTPSSIKSGLQSALKTAMGKKSKKARAVDEKTGQLIDMLFG
jgi:hypothetical protein